MVWSFVLVALGALGSLPVAPPSTVGAAPTSLDAALALVPGDAVAFVIVPSPKRASDDLEQCLERMDRPEAAMAGRPIDQVKALLGISAAFDDKGTFVIAQVPVAGQTDATPAPLIFAPTTDAAQFLASNFTAVPESGPQAYRARDGVTFFAKEAGKHAVMSTNREVVRGYVAGAGIGGAIRGRLGDRGNELLAKGDIVAWIGRDGIAALVREADAALEREQRAEEGAREEQRALVESAARLRVLAAGIDDGLLVVDLDPLGASVRTFARFASDSELGKLAAGGVDRPGRFDRLPQLPFYCALRMDIDGLGGIAALESLVKQLPAGASLPSWFVAMGKELRTAQFAVYPSRMGIATGGLLNDALLFLESERPEALRESLRSALLATAGERGGVRREPIWTPDKALKSGEVVDSFEVKETLLADSGDTKAGDLGVRRAISHALYGSRGLVGFVKVLSGGVVMTFSQRVDILDRALKTSAGGPSLASEGLIDSYREWLIQDADVEGFIGVGQFGKLIEQLVKMVPGGDQALLPSIPTTVEPVGFAIEIDRGTAETALVLPTAVLAIVYDQIKEQLLERVSGPRPTPPAESAP